MKKVVLCMAIIAMFSMPIKAQWTTDIGSGINIWPANYTNYGYTIQTNSKGYTFEFAHGVSVDSSSSTPVIHYPMLVQILDKNGKKLYDDDGLELCDEENISWTKVNTDMALDNEGNAIISVSDQRLGTGDSYTIYKVDTLGNLLWEGTTLNDNVSPGNTAAMRICPTADGGAIFAYEVYYSSSETPTHINIEKLNKDGKSVWQEQISSEVNETYPYLVDVGDNQAILVWAEGSTETLKARLLDFDGSSAWGEDLTIYKGGFSTNPLWTMMNVAKAKNGAIITWQDVDATTENYENRMSYILKDDGSFNFSDGENGTIISNESDLSRMYPDLFYDDNEDAIYTAYYVFNQSYQEIQGIYAQKLSAEGELMWGPNGVGVEPIEIKDGQAINYDTLNYYSSPSIRKAKDGEVAIFYLKQNGPYSAYGRVDAYMVIYDKNGNQIEAPKSILPLDSASKTSLTVSDLINNDHYIITWKNEVVLSTDESGNKTYGEDVQAACLYLDGTTTKINRTDQNTLRKFIRQERYNINGQRINTITNGMNIIRNYYNDGTSETKKEIVK